MAAFGLVTLIASMFGFFASIIFLVAVGRIWHYSKLTYKNSEKLKEEAHEQTKYLRHIALIAAGVDPRTGEQKPD